MSSLQINQSPLRRSSRIATIIPASYWTSIGYSEAGGQARVNLQLDMKRYCDGSDDEFTIIKLIPKDSEGEIYLRNFKLSHHDMMLPHWQKFRNSMSGRNTVKDVHLCGVHLPVSVLDIILPTFQSMNNLSSLTLYRTGLRNEGFRRLSSFLKKNTSIKQLDFFGDTIDVMSVATSFSDAVKNHPTLEQIGFTGIRGLKNNIILRKVLEGCSRVRALHLIRNAFDSEDAAILADFISSNHPTELLNLQQNNVSDNDTLLLA